MSPFDRNSLYGSAFKRTESFKSENSYLSGIKAFGDNVSVRSCLSYTYSLASYNDGKTLLKDAPFTVEMTRSIILLPEKPYRPRMADYRIGVFFTPRMQLGEGSRTTAPVYYANRWQLAPSDTAAFRRGEKVRPVKPIVFYVDSDFPAKWRPYIKEGINQWQELFEEIGFKDAIEARDFPTDDPEFDPDNLKYSCVRYAPIGIQNAMGPSWVDPRSGEILNASVYVYHDIVRLINKWRFVQTATVDEEGPSGGASGRDSGRRPPLRHLARDRSLPRLHAQHERIVGHSGRFAPFADLHPAARDHDFQSWTMPASTMCAAARGQRARRQTHARPGSGFTTGIWSTGPTCLFSKRQTSRKRLRSQPNGSPMP